MKGVRAGIGLLVVASVAIATGSASDAARRRVCKGLGKIIVGTPKRDIL
ncbi:MAG: hypothetical protein ACRDKU_08605 [Gaiellaceae bacterium]